MFAILFEVLLIKIPEESITLLVGRGGGGSRCTKIVNNNFVNKLAFPINGPFWRGHFPLWRGARKLPISVNGAFPLLNGPFSDLSGPGNNGPFPQTPQLMGRYPS